MIYWYFSCINLSHNLILECRSKEKGNAEDGELAITHIYTIYISSFSLYMFTFMYVFIFIYKFVLIYMIVCGFMCMRELYDTSWVNKAFQFCWTIFVHGLEVQSNDSSFAYSIVYIEYSSINIIYSDNTSRDRSESCVMSEKNKRKNRKRKHKGNKMNTIIFVYILVMLMKKDKVFFYSSIKIIEKKQKKNKYLICKNFYCN